MSRAPPGERSDVGAARVCSLLLADLVGSTAIVDELGDAAAAELFRAHDEAARSLVRRHQGQEIDKSDGFLLLFDRPVNAVRFALDYHASLRGLSEGADAVLSARVGVHLGEVVVRENPPEAVERGAKPVEIEGLAKPQAARIMALAGSGQTLLSRTAYEVARRGVVGDEGAAELTWVAHGSYTFAGLTEPVDVYEVGIPGVAPLAPPAESSSARRVAADKDGLLVLPFHALGANGDGSYLADGLTDELISALSGLESLRVISRTSAMQLRDTDKDLRTLGRELAVDFVLEGSVRVAGDRLRITTRLLRSDTEEQLWSDRHTGRMQDVFEIEESIARTVTEALQVRLSPDEKKRLGERAISDVQAYEFYLRAKQQVYRFTDEALDQAVAYLERGIEILGENHTLTAALGYVYWQYVNAGIRPDVAYLERARECAESILRSDPDSAAGHRLLGLVEIHASGDPATAIHHLRAALDENRNDTDALFWLALIYGYVGRPSSGLPLALHLLDIDPLMPLHHLVPGFLDQMDGQPERSLVWLAEAHEREPANPITNLAYGQSLAMAGRAEEAAAMLDRIERDAPGSFFGGLARALGAALAGDRSRAHEALTPEVAAAARNDMHYSWTLAQLHALLDEPEEAVGWLENAIDQGFWNYPLMAERDPLLAGARDHPAFDRALSKARDRWESLRV